MFQTVDNALVARALKASVTPLKGLSLVITTALTIWLQQSII